MASANFLSNFLDEHKEETPVVKPAAESKAESTNVKCGKLLVGGCLDWDKATSKAAEGLDGLSLIDLGGDVRKTFSSGNSLHCFILMEDSIVYAMGKNDRGQLGLGGKSKDTVTYPVKIPAIPSALPNVPLKIVKIATGRSHSLFLTEGGALYGCGSNQHGQLVTGCSKTAMLDSLKLIKIPIENIRDIACGNEFSLICTTSGKCYSFGSCESGQLGNGTAGQFLRDGPGKGPALQTSTVSSPTLIDRFITKDPSGKVTGELNANQIKISSVACGKNHAVCLEEAEWLTSSSGTSSSSSSGDGESMGRV
jgi:alpha-tubulin suppressor-like RCC1 family protein